MIIFYDGHCPLCRNEMHHLQRYDHQRRIEMVDIQSQTFAHNYPHLDWDALNNRIHVQLDDGTMISGLDATHKAWQAVGKGWLYAPLRWRIVRPVADWCYSKFARYRYTISFLLTGKRRGCEECIDDVQAHTVPVKHSKAKAARVRK
ncbi:thiol-disulfide oxidoreductase DCC family protein [Alteromonas halophila]|uniref:Redox protein n=1 Tax=Alteromonas halophila TaxID=516698 RepID=A0A918JR69_9ALTE|nr:DUF393 domain-containing protein [Alteromonas halophila]GGW91889.1 redox protein [Alteromonas halophila]